MKIYISVFLSRVIRWVMILWWFASKKAPTAEIFSGEWDTRSVSTGSSRMFSIYLRKGSHGSFARIRRYGLLYLKTAEYDHSFSPIAVSSLDEIQEFQVRGWFPTQEEILPYLSFTLLPVHGACHHVSSLGNDTFQTVLGIKIYSKNRSVKAA